MRIAAIIALLLSALPAHAQVSRASGVGSIPGLVRAYHFDRSGKGSSNLCDTSIGCPTLGIWFQQTVAATITPDIGSSYVMTVKGNPTRVSGPVWPSGLVTPGYNWRFDGTGDSLSVADAGGAFSSQAAWSVSCTIIPRAGFASGDVFAAKWNTTGNKRSWRLYTGGTSVVLDISSDGAAGTITTLTKAASIAANRLSHITASCDGAGNCSLWVDELAVSTSAAMGDPFEGDAAFSIGADAEGAGDVPADFFRCVYQDGALTAADHQRANRRFRGLCDGSGSNVITVADNTMPAIMLAPPDSGVNPFIVNMPANTSMLGSVASGSGGIYGASAVTNKCWRSSLETWAAGAPTGWTEGITSTGDCAQGTAATVHGSSVAACSTADADDAATLTSGCATVTGGTAMWLSAWAKTTSGAGLLDLRVLEDDSADCSSITRTTAVVDDAVPGAAWARYEGGITLQAGTIRAQVQIALPAAAAQATSVDAVQFRAGTYAVDHYCGADTDADVSCSAMVISTSDNGMISANGSAGISAIFRTPYAGTAPAANQVFLTDGNVAAANTIRIGLQASTDELYLAHYDSAAAAREIGPNHHDWTANSDHTVEFTWNGLGLIQGVFDGVWRLVASGAGTGKRNAQQATLYIAGSQASGNDVWIRDLRIYRRMIDVGLYKPLMVAIGDSIAQWIYEDLAALYPGTCFLNSGVGGNTLATTLARFNADALSYGPAAVYLHDGVNDVAAGRSAAAMEADTEAIADLCDAAGVVLIVSNVGTNTAYTAPQLLVLADYNAWLAGAFAAAHPTAIVLDFLAWAEDGSADPKVCNAAWFDATCVHPNTTGNPLWAAIVKAAYP